MASELTTDAPAPRLCHLVKWPDFDGYGFNLHAEKAKTGQFIGKVDDGSPAEQAGLREGDRIIEVNGVNIANENHRQVVERIKAMVNETKLLVLDEVADNWYKERKLVVKGTQSNVIYKKTPSSQSAKIAEVATHNAINGSKESKNSPPTENEPKIEAQESKKQSQVEENTNGVKKTNTESQKLTSVNGKSSPQIKREEIEEPKEVKESVKVDAQNGNSSNGSGANINNNNNSVKKSSIQQPVQQNSSTNSNTGKADNKEDLNLNMSAAQMREMLANRKKRDPRKQTLDMKEKYQIVQQM